VGIVDYIASANIHSKFLHSGVTHNAVSSLSISGGTIRGDYLYVNNITSDGDPFIGLETRGAGILTISGTASFIGSAWGLGDAYFNPTSIFHIKNVGGGTDIAIESDAGDASVIIDSDTNNDGYVIFKEAGAEKFNIIHDASQSHLYIYDNDATTTAVSISGGRVGINKTIPINYQLDVNGSIYGTSVSSQTISGGNFHGILPMTYSLPNSRISSNQSVALCQ
ncbi:unnamed protein product, partial [marine sediment metagenome]